MQQIESVICILHLTGLEKIDTDLEGVAYLFSSLGVGVKSHIFCKRSREKKVFLWSNCIFLPAVSQPVGEMVN